LPNLQCLDEYFGDPDKGKEIKEEVKQRLIESMKRRETGDRISQNPLF
jgi:hypothetical protein